MKNSYVSGENRYNIPSPEPFIAGTSKKMLFKVIDSDTNLPYNLTSANDIIFSICIFGREDSTLDLYLSKNNPENPHLVIDPEKTDSFNELLVNLYSEDTSDFIGSRYVFQITCTSSDNMTNSIFGQGVVDVIGNIRNKQ